MNENATTQTTTTTTNLIDDVLRGDYDAEFTAYRKAHPELAKMREGMTREEKTEYIISLFEKLGLIEEATPEEKAAEKEYKALKELLSHQCLTPDIDSFYHNYISRRKEENYDECLLFLDIFNYGKICGKREERSCRRGELS
jgi:hypothetical protein